MRGKVSRGASKGRSSTDGMAEGKQAARQDWKPMGDDCGLSDGTVKDLNNQAKEVGFDEDFPRCGNVFEQADWFRSLDLYEFAHSLKITFQIQKSLIDAMPDDLLQ